MTIKEAGLRPPHTCRECPGRLETDPEARLGVPGAPPGALV